MKSFIEVFDFGGKMIVCANQEKKKKFIVHAAHFTSRALSILLHLIDFYCCLNSHMIPFDNQFRQNDLNDMQISGRHIKQIKEKQKNRFHYTWQMCGNI